MTPYPAKAVILAAGFGTRMRPLSYDTPKPLMPLWNRPLLDHILDFLSGHGVGEVLINLHYRAGDVVAHLRGRRPASLRINFSFEPEILGTGGALRRAAWFLDRTPFWMVNADIAFDLDIKPLLRQMQNTRPLAALWLTDQTGPRTVEMRDGLIRNFRSHNPGGAGTYTFTGLHLLSPRILDYLPATGCASIIHAYEKAQIKGQHIAGVCPRNCYWNDLGTPASYLAAHAETYRRAGGKAAGARLSGLDKTGRMPMAGHRPDAFTASAPDAKIAHGADTARAVVWSGARLGTGTVAHDAVIGRGCGINHPVVQTAVNAGFLGHDLDLRTVLTQLDWPAKQTAVIPLEPRGSARVFTRLVCRGQSVIMVQYLHERMENKLYARHTHLLRDAGVHVPHLLFDQPRKRLLLLEDLGAASLETILHNGTMANLAIEKLYYPVLDNVLRLHWRAGRLADRRGHKTMASFTPRLYKWEREFFARQFLQRHPQCQASMTSRIMAELRDTAAVLRASPYSLIHRDLQSTNVLFREQTPCFIDFQGMRRGPIAYDLASLLCDPYVELDEKIIPRLLAYYNRQAPAAHRVSEEIFWHAAVERLAQALGAYGRLGADPATRRFTAYIPPALRRLTLALKHLKIHPALKEACIIFTDYYNTSVSI